MLSNLSADFEFYSANGQHKIKYRFERDAGKTNMHTLVKATAAQARLRRLLR